MSNTDKAYKRYLNYIIFAFILSGVMSLFVGCSGDVKDVLDSKTTDIKIQNSQENEQIITSSFPLKEYTNSFVTFKYPEDFEPITLEKYPQSYRFNYDKNTIIVLTDAPKKELGKITTITFKEFFDSSINNSDQARKDYIDKKNSSVSFEIFDDKSYLKSNIAIVDGVLYNVGNYHSKTYFWNNGQGKTYQIEINTDKDNWNNIQEIVSVFEQSLKFK